MAPAGVPGARLAPALALTVFMGCAGARAPRHPHPTAAEVLTPEQQASVDREYFLAVGAYSRGDYAGALVLVKQILAADPTNRDALSLRGRIIAAQKAGGP